MSVLAAGAGPGCRVGLIRSLSAFGCGSSQSCRNVVRAGIDVLSAKDQTACWLSIQILMSLSASTLISNTHTAAVVGATGAVLEHLTVPADPAGYRQLIGFGRRHDARLWAIEGTGSFGAGLTTELLHLL